MTYIVSDRTISMQLIRIQPSVCFFYKWLLAKVLLLYLNCCRGAEAILWVFFAPSGLGRWPFVCNMGEDLCG